MDIFAQIQSAAHDGAFGNGGLPEPSLANLRAGNYKKGRVKLYGLPIAIETPQGTRRTGKSDGKPWSVICMAHYGYIEKTKGADGDALDVFIGPWPESERVVVINRESSPGTFDEHKLLLGFPTYDAAISAYTNSYEKGQAGIGSAVVCTIDQLKWWIAYGNHAIPLELKHLPFDGDSMNDVNWDQHSNPIETTVPQLLYALRRDDASEHALLDAVTIESILEDADGEIVLDGLVLPLNQLERKLNQMQIIMRAAGDKVKPVGMQITEPFKQRGTTNVAAIFEMSDGQTISVYFHNPDSTPNRLTPDDEMVSWKWLLNKRDITIVVAKERGKDMNPREVARRVMKLVDANSERFQNANAKKAERMAAIEAGKAEIGSKEQMLEGLKAEITDLETKVEAKRNRKPATLQGGDIVTTATQDGQPAVVQAQLPNGWTEASPGGLLTNPDQVSGGIVDKTILTGEWFYVAHHPDIETKNGFTSREDALNALLAEIAAVAKGTGLEVIRSVVAELGGRITSDEPSVFVGANGNKWLRLYASFPGTVFDVESFAIPLGTNESGSVFTYANDDRTASSAVELKEKLREYLAAHAKPAAPSAFNKNAAETEEHKSDAILRLLTERHGWRKDAYGAVLRDFGGGEVSNFNPRGIRTFTANFDDRARYVQLNYGGEVVLDMDTSELTAEEAAAEFNQRAEKYAKPAPAQDNGVSALVVKDIIGTNVFKIGSARYTKQRGEYINGKGESLKVGAALKELRGSPIEVDSSDDLKRAGKVKITDVGSENVYFEYGYLPYFTKLLNPDDYASRIGETVDLGAQDDSEQDAFIAVAVEAAKNKEIVRLRNQTYFTFDFEGDEVIVNDEIIAQVEAAIGEKLVETELNGGGHIALVPESQAASPASPAIDYLRQVIAGEVDLGSPEVADKLEALYHENGTNGGSSEFDALFEQAAEAYQNHVLAAAKAAMG